MFTRIDHVVIAVPDLARGIEQYRRLGFEMHPGGVHDAQGTHNAIAFNREDYLELLAIRDRARHDVAASGAPSWATGLAYFIEAGGGIRWIVVQSDDLEADVAAMRGRGIEVSDAMAGSRRTPAGQELLWKNAMLGPANSLPIFFIEHVTPIERRRSQVPPADHPNGVVALERAYIAVQHAKAASAEYAEVLGIPEPPLQRGTVIMANMAVFQLGETSLGIAEPYAEGPAKDALDRRGPGAFQALYRTKSMAAAARYMEQHGVPAPARGVRNTGEQAMLVPPADACGAYIGLVGPE